MDNSKVYDVLMSQVKTIEDVRFVQELLRTKMASIRTTKRYTLKSGDPVKFTSRGMSYSGVIEKIKVKNAVVFDLKSMTRWNVPLTILEAA
jgi:hypothetical protein